MKTTHPAPVLTARHYFDDAGQIWHMVSVEGGPCDLLTRATVAAALEDGAAYVAKHYGRRADGTWTPFRAPVAA